MSVNGSAPARTWTRRAPGSVVLLFLLFSAGLWLGSLFAWEVRQPELVIGLLAIGAFLPVAWLGIRLRTHPVWALQVPADRRAVADALRIALRDRRATEVAPEDAGRERLFRDCETLLRLEDPACLVGVRRASGEPWTTLLLLPRSRDRTALDRLRETIATRVGAA